MIDWADWIIGIFLFSLLLGILTYGLYKSTHNTSTGRSKGE